MQTLTDAQSAVVQGGGKLATVKLNVSPATNITPTIVVLPQVNVGTAVALFGSRATLFQGNIAGVKA
jgi:hypothetical protein